MSDETKETLAVIIVVLGTGIVGTTLGILRFGPKVEPDLRKEFNLLIVKIFSAITVGGIVVALLLKYHLL